MKTAIKIAIIAAATAFNFQLSTFNCSAQNIGINSTGNLPDASALLDVDAAPGNDKGLLIPRMTTAQMNAIAMPATGLMIYNTDCNVYDYYNGTAWVPFPSNASAPATPGVITGSTTPGCMATGVTYSITAVTNATSYYWTVPTGATVATGQGTTSITINFGSISGNVCVTASNACGTSSPSCTTITIPGPAQPSVITGTSPVCQGDNGVTYSVTNVVGVTYAWTYSGTGYTCASGCTTNAITANFSATATSGTLTVTPSNACGSGTAQTFAVTVNTLPAVPTAGTNTPSQTQIVWNWNTSAGATAYYYNTVNNFSTATNNGASTSYTQTGLTCNTADTLYVWAVNGCGNSAAATLTQTTSTCITPGIIMAWSGTLASIPTGWTLCDGTNGTPDLIDNFIKGAPPATDAGGTGGTLTHNHTGVTGTTNLTTGASGTATCGVNGNSCSWLANPQSHTHPYNHSHTISSASNLPPYYQVAFIMSTSSATSMTPDGIIAVWSGTLASIPANWMLCDGTIPTVNLLNLFLQGAPASTNPGATGGSATHDHGGTAVDNTLFTPLYSPNGTGNCGIGCASWGGNAPGQGHDHTYSHSHTVSSASNLPPYFEVAFTMANNATFIPSGLIAQWSGTLATIPAGWVLCDGSLSTPNLTNRFVKGVPNAITNPGTTGGSSASHDHSGVTGTDPGGTSSTNGATNGLAGGTSRMAVHSHSVPAHSHTISSDSNEPPYYEIAFIMKQ